MVPASVARADGDPGSDVLVYQPLFLGADSGVSISQQSQLGGLLRSAAHAGFPVRVAIISSRTDLGAVTGLWRQPRNYARFLGLELSLSYKGRLLVVMPNGIGFNWPGHSSADAYRRSPRSRSSPGAAVSAPPLRRPCSRWHRRRDQAGAAGRRAGARRRAAGRVGELRRAPLTAAAATTF